MPGQCFDRHVDAYCCQKTLVLVRKTSTLQVDSSSSASPLLLFSKVPLHASFLYRRSNGQLYTAGCILTLNRTACTLFIARHKQGLCMWVTLEFINFLTQTAARRCSTWYSFGYFSDVTVNFKFYSLFALTLLTFIQSQFVQSRWQTKRKMLVCSVKKQTNLCAVTSNAVEFFLFFFGVSECRGDRELFNASI